MTGPPTILAFSEGDLLLAVWILCAALAVSAVVAALVWAVRHGQFRHLDRAAALALTSGIPHDGEDHYPSPLTGEGGPSGPGEGAIKQEETKGEG